ncbi:MAG TPA: hypothetical protein VEJ16_01665 [Alphaproteobacteria bacterium]|nr:hypothetical protein [Alphaproteobacteria bacterium]
MSYGVTLKGLNGNPVRPDRKFDGPTPKPGELIHLMCGGDIISARVDYVVTASDLDWVTVNEIARRRVAPLADR